MDSIELIKAIAELWKLGAVVFLTTALIVFRSKLRNLKLKRGNTEAEVQLDGEHAPKQLPPARDGETGTAEEAPEPAQDDATPIAITTELSLDKGKHDDPFMSIIGDLFDKNTKDAHATFEALQAGESDPVQRKRNQVSYDSLLAEIVHDADALRRLREFTSDSEVSAHANRLLGFLHERTGSLTEARAAFAAALESETKPQLLAIAGSSLAEVEKQLGRQDRGRELLIALVRDSRLSGHSEARGKVFESLADCFPEDHVMRAVSYQRAAELQPTSARLRFQAAYAYSQAKDDEFASLAVFHYTRLLRTNPDHWMARNNLGVALKSLGAAGSAAEQYYDAWLNGESLAASNLANILMDAGLHKPAAALLHAASHLDNVHPNVGHSISRLDNIKRDETSVYNTALSSGAQVASFMTAYADSYVFQDEPLKFANCYRVAHREVRITRDGSTVKATWGEENKRTRLVGSITGGAVSGTLEVERVKFLSTPLAHEFEVVGTFLAARTSDGIHVLTMRDGTLSEEVWTTNDAE